MKMKRVDDAIKLLTWTNLQTRVNTINYTSIGEFCFEKEFKFDVSHMGLPKAAAKAAAYGFLDSRPEPWAL
jgi:hypothetical protein